MDRKRRAIGHRFFLGIILLLVGLIMILYKSNIIGWEVYDFLLSWKMLLVAFGVFVFIEGSYSIGVIIMALGAFFLLPDIFPYYIDNIRRFFWPVVILVVGIIIMIVPGKHKYGNNHIGNNGNNPSDGGSTPPPYTPNDGGFNGEGKTNSESDFKTSDDVNSYKQQNTTRPTTDFYDESVVFGGRDLILTGKNFKGGRSAVLFGGLNVDARQCQMSPEGCSIELTTLFGGTEYKVPNDWTVINKVTTIFGGYSDVRIKDPMYQPNPSKTVIITGVCIFGGTEVRNYVR